MLPERPNKLHRAWFNWYCRYALRKHFRAVHLFREDDAEAFDPNVSHLYVANHVGFWDGIVLNYLVRSRFQQPLFALVDAVQMRAHPFFQRVGAFSVDRTNPRDGVLAVTHAADLLNTSACALVLFPQGTVTPPDLRPLRFEGGVAHIVERSPRTRVVPVALRYDFWSDQRPECMVHVGRARRFADISRRAIVETLADDVTRLSDALRRASDERRAASDIVLHGRQSIAKC